MALELAQQKVAYDVAISKDNVLTSAVQLDERPDGISGEADTVPRSA